GRFVTANRLPPTPKPRDHCISTLREVSSSAARSDRIPKRILCIFCSTSCPCGERRQAREHILCYCPLFNRQRIHLHEFSRHLILSEIMGTEKGITAMVKFLEESDTFKNGRQ
ncbi:uncharacterized protein BJ212DRAFT_1282164, partial [Suillus subaureus]